MANTLNVIFQAVALGMGIAVLVLRIMNVIDADTSVIMLAIGMFAQALKGLRKQKELRGE